MPLRTVVLRSQRPHRAEVPVVCPACGGGLQGPGVGCEKQLHTPVLAPTRCLDHPQCALSLSASQRSISLKKQRGRSILSSFFCCFRDYNVEAPPPSSPSVLPPLVEENGGLQKVSTYGELPSVKLRHRVRPAVADPPPTVCEMCAQPLKPWVQSF